MTERRKTKQEVSSSSDRPKRVEEQSFSRLIQMNLLAKLMISSPTQQIVFNPFLLYYLSAQLYNSVSFIILIVILMYVIICFALCMLIRRLSVFWV